MPLSLDLAIGLVYQNRKGVREKTPIHEEMLRGLLLALRQDMDQQVHQLNKLAMMFARMLLEAPHMDNMRGLTFPIILWICPPIKWLGDRRPAL
jgi:hypothetical protein